jgi:PD-(D/E)XK endonuclease
MDTIRRGNAAEAAVLNAMVRADFHVFTPFGEGAPYDLLVDTNSELIRVQVKCARLKGECLLFNSCSTDHGQGRLSYDGRADVFGIYSPQIDRVYVIPVQDCPRFQTSLRLVPTRNSQSKGVRYAGDHAVESWAASLSRAAA